MLNICQTCSRNGRCRLAAEMAHKIVVAWARGEVTPECDDYQERCWHGVKGVAA